MYEKLDVCPACKHPKFNNYLICEDHTVTGESFALVQCSNCSLIFTNPRPSLDSLGKYYAHVDYISHSNSTRGLLHMAYKLVRQVTLRRKRLLIEKYVPTGHLLDFGCGTGHFLQHCQKNQWLIHGVEIDDQTRARAQSRLGITLDADLSLRKDKYDAITAWHVIEHVYDLKGTLKTLRKRLKKDGYLFVALPNPSSQDALHYKSHWAGYDVPRHLYHFTPESFIRLIKKHRFLHVDTLPMTFDAYYLSFLSERYRAGKNRYLAGFRAAQQSNRSADITGEFSGLIYILTK